jgi:RNA polymerase sigma-70 factor (ECF subfamily)
MAQSLNLFCNDLKSGNSNLFSQLFSDYYVNLCRFAFTYLKDREASEEIVQEMFISLWENRNKLNINTSVRAFLYTSVKNKALNYLRDEKTRKGHENGFSIEQSQKVDKLIDFCEREELQHLITDAVNDLPEQCQIIFKMSREQNLTYNEIAQQLDVSPKTVENQMGIALKKLRNKLSPYLTGIIAFL